METAVLILTYNGIVDTAECIESLKKSRYKDFDIIVVDNLSKDGTPDIIRASYQEVTLIINRENLGYAEGNNVGIRYCIEKGYKYIFIINNDITLEEDTMDILINEMSKDSDIGVIGPTNYSYYDKNQVLFNSSFLDVEKSMFKINTKMCSGDLIPTDYVNGAAMLVRTSILSNVGLLDHNYFLYWEEADLCFRIRQKGYKCLVSQKSKIYHKESASLDDKIYSPIKNYYFYRNKLYFFRKHNMLSMGLFYRFFKEYIRLMINCIKSKPGKFTTLCRSLWLAFFDYSTNTFGKQRL